MSGEKNIDLLLSQCLQRACTTFTLYCSCKYHCCFLKKKTAHFLYGLVILCFFSVVIGLFLREIHRFPVHYPHKTTEIQGFGLFLLSWILFHSIFIYSFFHLYAPRTLILSQQNKVQQYHVHYHVMRCELHNYSYTLACNKWFIYFMINNQTLMKLSYKWSHPIKFTDAKYGLQMIHVSCLQLCLFVPTMLRSMSVVRYYTIWLMCSGHGVCRSQFQFECNSQQQQKLLQIMHMARQLCCCDICNYLLWSGCQSWNAEIVIWQKLKPTKKHQLHVSWVIICIIK